MTDWQLLPGRALRGRVEVPGDKSVAHRALMLAAIAEGASRLTRVPVGGDVRSTVGVLRALNVVIEQDGDVWEVAGVGLDGLRPPAGVLDCGNSGTTLRLMAGLLAGAGISASLSGDRSLCLRPMARIAEPLRAMGAAVHLHEGDRAPLALHGGSVRAVTYRSPMASAQVKSCVLLAGLYADGTTRVVESRATRDHTERLLRHMGAEIDDREGIAVRGRPRLAPLRGAIPGDVSSAAFWLVAASVVPGSVLELPGVGVNPTRRALIDLLHSWGADIEEVPEAPTLGEPQATLRVRAAARLRGGTIDAADVAALIDELPLLGMLGPLTADGVEVRGATELRHKESDRVATTCAALRVLGVAVQEFPDGFAVSGGQVLGGGVVDAHADHRIVLAAAAVAGAAGGLVRIRGAEAAAVSYPGFLAQWHEATR